MAAAHVLVCDKEHRPRISPPQFVAVVMAAGAATQPSTTTKFATSSAERLIQAARGEEHDMRALLPGNRLVKGWLRGWRGAGPGTRGEERRR